MPVPRQFTLEASISTRSTASTTNRRSIADTIDDLHVAHRQRRQNVITAELLDIISGYEAITGDMRR